MSTWRTRWGRSGPPAEVDVSEVVATLSALHRAGLSLTSAFAEVAALDGSGLPPRAITEAIATGSTPHDAIATLTQNASEPWRAVGACCAIARVTGTPLGPALAALAEALRDSSRTERAVAAALAGPQATMRLVMVLPIVGMLGGALAGQGTLTFLVTTPLGFGLLISGAVMLAMAWGWLRYVSARALPPAGSLSLESDLFAGACGGGASPERARAIVRENMAFFGLTTAHADQLDGLISLSRRAGVPVAALARSRAALNRDLARTDAEHRLQRLGVAVVVPLGILVLPAFVLLSVVPMAVILWDGAVG